MKKWAYYNEHDPYAAQWIRNLIAAGHITDGEVDERSIEDVLPIEVATFMRCHWFAGIAVWDYALRRAGWPDDRPVWTGSCPCQPFSAAGKGVGFADERHLWPAWEHLIRHGKPRDVVIFGEQVASKDGLGWLDLVHADLEGQGYTVGAVDLCAAGVGAPHIRQRSWFVADSAREQRGRAGSGRATGRTEHSDGGATGGMGDDDDDEGLEGFGGGHQTESGRVGEIRSVAEAGEFGGMADARDCAGQRSEPWAIERRLPQDINCDATVWPRPTNGFWRDADWLFCRDGKWRPVESKTFPLAHGASSRVGRLRAYGNAINAEAAEAVIRAYMECRP